MAWYRIMARNREAGTAYAERISTFRQLDNDGWVCVIDTKGGSYFGDMCDLIEDPEIIQRCSADWLYKIKLPDQKGVS